MKEIQGKAKTVRELLSGQRYSIDYYQREFKWKRKQVQELVDDLTQRFLDDYDETDERDEVQNYGHYFLGSIILSKRDNETFIVDGQQRLTTLTLLLVLLHHRQGDREDAVALPDMIFSEKYGQRKFNIHVPDRVPVMEALFKDEAFDPSDGSESVQHIYDRYSDLDELLPDDISGRALPFFVDWLRENVHLVQITAMSDEDAYTIFETMNDRGLSLSPLDMLKGYLLNNITDPTKRNEAAKTWLKRTEALRALGKEEDSDAVKTWLRAKHAQTVRERKRGAENRDFERIGSEFHRWVRDNSDAMGLKSSDDYLRFIQRDFSHYARIYARLQIASERPVDGLEVVYYVTSAGFTLQYPLYLAPITPDDDPANVDQKIRIVGTYLDILIARRAVNYLSMGFNNMAYNVFISMLAIRDLPPDKLAKTLHDQLANTDCDFDGANDGKRSGIKNFYLNHWSKRYIKWLLARMTDHVERASGQPSQFANYMLGGKKGFEVEHIWADKYERHTGEFGHESEFADYRNRMGGLLLLPKSFNASYGALPYDNKLDHYNAQNLLARSLHPNCYDHNPGFKRFVQESDLPFRSMEQFRKANLDERTDLYRQLADQVWDPNQLQHEAEGQPGPAISGGVPT